jgi:hypothetical protein
MQVLGQVTPKNWQVGGTCYVSVGDASAIEKVALNL